VSKLFDIFGLGTGKKFYLRDFKNAYHFRPDVNPVRHKFQGYVNFIFNRESQLFRELYADPSDGSKEFRTTLSTLVRTADLPAVQFNTEVKNEYNRKKIVNLGVQYNPVGITVYDTVGNEWLQVLMRYFSYHYMDPRNKSGTPGGTGARDIAGERSRIGGAENVNANTFMAEDTWDSNRAGYNPNVSANFFERIDYVLYHGNRGVQYSIINPVLTKFQPGSIDYSDSGFMDFQMEFEYESFTTHNVQNFGLSAEDVDRFENVSAMIGPAFAEAELPLSMQVPDPDSDSSGQELNMLGKTSTLGGEDSYRSRQPQPTDDGTQEQVDTGETDEEGNPIYEPKPPATIPAVYGPAVDFASAAAGDGKYGLDDLIGDVADSALTALIHGTSVKDAVLGQVVGSTLTIVQQDLEADGDGDT